jgi:hypothetical protein
MSLVFSVVSCFFWFSFMVSSLCLCLVTLFFWGTRVWTQGLTLAKQAVYHLSPKNINLLPSVKFLGHGQAGIQTQNFPSPKSLLLGVNSAVQSALQARCAEQSSRVLLQRTDAPLPWAFAPTAAGKGRGYWPSCGKQMCGSGSPQPGETYLQPCAVFKSHNLSPCVKW